MIYYFIFNAANSDPAPGCVDQKLNTTVLPVPEEEPDNTIAVENFVMIQKRFLLDFMNFMKSPEYKSQLEVEVAKEKVCLLKVCCNYRNHKTFKLCHIVNL